MTKPPFPLVFDSSSIAAARSCLRKFELEYLEHWKPGLQSVHLVAGGAYAAGLEAARRGYFVESRSIEDSIALGCTALLKHYGDFQCPPDSAKSLERTLGALEFYFERYPLDEDRAVPITLANGTRGIELNFSEPIDLEDPEMRHPLTGDPLLYVGRLDQAVDYNGLVLGEDDKTASQLGAKWPSQWDLRSQFTGYVWGMAKLGLRLDGFLIRGVSILKRSYDTLEAITQRPQWQLDRWHFQLKRDVKRIRAAWDEGYFDYDLDHACTEYGGCIFKQACLMVDPAPLLEQQFSRRRWDPVSRREIPIRVDEAGNFHEQEVS